MKSIQPITLGCSKNDVDTEHLLAQLPGDGFKLLPSDWSGSADVVLINTCGFIGDAKEESINVILETVERKKRGDVGGIAVFGCLSQRYEAELREEIPEVDAWFGARDLRPVLDWLLSPDHKPTGASNSQPVPECSGNWTSRYISNPKPYAYLKISEGCDRRCSYCAIPFIRGAHKSVPMETLVEEAGKLAATGVKELILIAQDTTFYGLDLYGKRALGKLLDSLSEVEGIEWIRIHYSYPADFPEDVLERMATNPKICKYLDIPLQHIADPVLKVMHRGAGSEWTRSLIARLRKTVPGVALRTTMIVGHPGEGNAEFDELLDFVREARFERLGAFSYSEEEGTWGASHLVDDIPAEEKQRRLDALMSLQSEISLAFNRSRIGAIERVLVDDFVPDSPDAGTLVCRSQFESPDVDGEILVKITGSETARNLVGHFINVRILGADEYDLIAELL